MTNFDDRLSAALHELDTGTQRPLESIERRARTIRHRRRGAAAGVAVVAAGAIAFPALPPIESEPRPAPDPATTEQLPPCESWESSAVGEPLPLDEVPDRLRLLWADDAAPPPEEASMYEYSEAELIIERTWPTECVMPEPSHDDEPHQVRVFEISDSVVTRHVGVDGPHDDPPWDVTEDVRTLDAAVGPVSVFQFSGAITLAWWPAAEGQYWASWFTGGMSDEVLVELAESVTFTDDAVDLGDWSGLESTTHVFHGSDRGKRTAPGGDELSSFAAHGSSVDLRAEDGFTEDELWNRVDVGDRFVEVNGAPGLLKSGPSGQLNWVTDDGVLVTLDYTGSDGQDDLLEIGRSVGPVPADDERLVAAWRTGPDPVDHER